MFLPCEEANDFSVGSFRRENVYDLLRGMILGGKNVDILCAG